MFWKNRDEAGEYTRAERIIEACRESFAQGADLERELLLATFDRTAPIDEAKGARDWKKVQEVRDGTWKVIEALHDELNPEDRACVVGIYGHQGMADRLRKIYAEIAELADLSSEWRCLDLVAGEKYVSRRPDQEPPPGADRIVGMEIEITGPAAFLLLTEEEGLHEWPWQDTIERVVVQVENCRLKKIGRHRPRNIHRSSFYQNRKARRAWQAYGFVDKKYNEQADKLPLSKSLHEILLKRVRKEMLDWLGPGVSL